MSSSKHLKLWAVLIIALAIALIAGCAANQAFSDRIAEANPSDTTTPKQAIAGDADEEDSALGSEVVADEEPPQEAVDEAEKISQEVQAENPVVTDAMREVMEQHSISEDNVPATPDEASAAILNDEKLPDEDGGNVEDVKKPDNLLDKAVNAVLGEPAYAQGPNCTNPTPVAVFRNGTSINVDDLHSIQGAIDNQLWSQYSNYWHCAYAYYAPTQAQIGAGSYILYIQDTSAAPFGYHSYNGTVGPFGIVGVNWGNSQYTANSYTRMMSHEALEMLLNPYPGAGTLDSHVTAPANSVGGPSNDYVSIVAEASDPVTSDAQGYFVTSTYYQTSYGYRSWKMSDFLLPAWFINGHAGPWSYNNQAPGPFQLANINTEDGIIYYYPVSGAGNGTYVHCYHNGATAFLSSC